MKLYHYWRSSCSWRLRWAFFYKDIEFETVAVDLLKGEQRKPEFLEKNPLAFVPVLELANGATLTESWSILEWVEESFPTQSLIPKDLLQKQRMRALSSIIFSATQPLQNPSVFKRHSEHKEDQHAWAKHFICKGLKAFADLRSSWDQPGSFSIGDQLSFADLCLIPQLYNARRFDIDLNAYPSLLEIENACTKTKGFAQAHPDSYKP